MVRRSHPHSPARVGIARRGSVASRPDGSRRWTNAFDGSKTWERTTPTSPAAKAPIWVSSRVRGCRCRPDSSSLRRRTSKRSSSEASGPICESARRTPTHSAKKRSLQWCSDLRALVRKAGLPAELRSEVLDGYHRLGPNELGRGPVVCNRRGFRDIIVRGHERDIHERAGRRGAPRTNRRLLGVALQRCGASRTERRSTSAPSRRSPSWCSAWWTPTARASCSPSIPRRATHRTS